MADDLIRAALDPKSDFPQPNLRTHGEQEHIKEWMGPAGSSKPEDMKVSNSDLMKQEKTGGTDAVEGVNRWAVAEGLGHL
ncbi:hypothetical protein MNEG_4634 [Monoraphidium neglectum]|uniref:Uncharacterized protein n=1 Tax=Monoraphidium neglectum TaxID=145388 RepID=A0A0D2MK15_9CHLO|nr:hypothetical protein MNEG_4634 [Monoraphidium neglectum]KIZ03330.1 hypothetical protein MNEG_4634 [Monoraphidium neglectum]|eukprot:XP_013902349.1 hypothetical protein MNEG_4634 [Monoraphidium neglectum]